MLGLRPPFGQASGTRTLPSCQKTQVTVTGKLRRVVDEGRLDDPGIFCIR